MYIININMSKLKQNFVFFVLEFGGDLIDVVYSCANFQYVKNELENGLYEKYYHWNVKRKRNTNEVRRAKRSRKEMFKRMEEDN